MGYIGVITHLQTIDPNFQQDIQVQGWPQVNLYHGQSTCPHVNYPHEQNKVWKKGVINHNSWLAMILYTLESLNILNPKFIGGGCFRFDFLFYFQGGGCFF